MGYRISWLAIEGSGRNRLLGALGLAATGEVDEANEAPFSVADLPTGWTVLWANDEEYVGARARELSRHFSPLLAVHVNETCMHSTASLYATGERRWHLHHEGDERVDFLEKEGVLPSEAVEIESELRRRQAEEDAGRAEVDYLFDIPLEIAKMLCGFKHDDGLFDWGEPTFTVVEPVSVQSGKLKRYGIFARWLGRG